MDRNSPPWFRANLHVFKMYLLCIFNVFAVYFQIEIYLYSGALKIGGAGVKRGRQIEFM